MALRPEFRAFVVEQFADFGRVKLRPMFGFAGIFSGDTILGVVADGRVYLKTDERSRKVYKAEGSKPFTFHNKTTGETIVTSYFELPERLYDDSDELVRWARQAHEVASNSPTARKKRRACGARQPAKLRKRS